MWERVRGDVVRENFVAWVAGNFEVSCYVDLPYMASLSENLAMGVESGMPQSKNNSWKTTQEIAVSARPTLPFPLSSEKGVDG